MCIADTICFTMVLRRGECKEMCADRARIHMYDCDDQGLNSIVTHNHSNKSFRWSTVCIGAECPIESQSVGAGAVIVAPGIGNGIPHVNVQCRSAHNFSITSSTQHSDFRVFSMTTEKGKPALVQLR